MESTTSTQLPSDRIAPSEELVSTSVARPPLEPHPHAASIPAPVDIRIWLSERVDGPVCAAVAVAWLVLMEIAMAVEPATTKSEPVIGVLLQLAMWFLLATMITGLVMQRRLGLVASLGGAVLATAASIACPISGHHQFGNWWFAQIACVLALVAVSVVALRRQPSTPVAPRS